MYLDTANVFLFTFTLCIKYFVISTYENTPVGKVSISTFQQVRNCNLFIKLILTSDQRRTTIKILGVIWIRYFNNDKNKGETGYVWERKMLRKILGGIKRHEGQDRGEEEPIKRCNDTRNHRQSGQYCFKRSVMEGIRNCYHNFVILVIGVKKLAFTEIVKVN